MLIRWLLPSYYVRAEQLQQRSDGSQSLKYLLSDPFQKKVVYWPLNQVLHPKALQFQYVTSPGGKKKSIT